MGDENLSEIYHMLIGQLQFEGKLIWTRHQVFFVLNSAIFAGLSLSNRPGVTGIDVRIVYAASVFGVVLCVLWFLTAIRSQVYYRYWITQTRAIENRMNSSSTVFRDLYRAHLGEVVKIGDEEFSFKPIERFASISRISRFVAVAFTVIWIGLAIVFSS
jgi:hypothetical protein